MAEALCASQKQITLQSLCEGILPLPDGWDFPVSSLTMDSRKVKSGSVFLAVAGQKTCAEHYVPHALSQGAACVLVDCIRSEIGKKNRGDSPVIEVVGLHALLGQLFSRFYGTEKMSIPVVGVTGTNGKTSVTYFVASLLQALQHVPQGVMGTTGVGVLGDMVPSSHTTPDVEQVHRLLGEIGRKAGSISMEVSSHALEQNRVAGVRFSGAVFTNLTRDHLDYHPSMEAYAQAKLKLLAIPFLKWVVVNVDDKVGQNWVSSHITAERIIRYGVSKEKADLVAERLTYSGIGISGYICWQKQSLPFSVALYGEFNVYNLLAAVGVLIGLGYPLENIVDALGSLPGVPGRMERITPLNEGNVPVVLVDYAHTPDALEKALWAMKAHQNGKLWCVFGCGGNRDAGKRPLMGAIAAREADFVVVTSDNPRNENPKTIIEDILEGVVSGKEKLSVQVDRKQAIEQAIQLAGVNDMILIAGKGHEDYQEINGVRIPFSDAEIVKQAMQQRLAVTASASSGGAL